MERLIRQQSHRSKATEEVKNIEEKLELREQLDTTSQSDAFWHAYPELRKDVEEVRTFFAQLPASEEYYIPNFA